MNPSKAPGIMDPSPSTGSDPKQQDESKSSVEEISQASSPRTNLIDLAVKFLTNPRVMDSPMEQKRAFLEKKGLTEAEINRAIQLVGPMKPQSNNQIVQAPPLPARPLTLAPAPRTWREYALMTAIVGGVGYALYHFIKNYLIPWFNRPRLQEQQLNDMQSSVEQLQISVREMVASVNESTKALRDLLSEQQQHIQLLSTKVTTLQSSISQTGGGQNLREIKDEVGTLKGLLLNRHQFPPTPSRTGSLGSGIPQWQRAQTQSTPTTHQNGLSAQSGSEGSSPETNRNGLNLNGSNDELGRVTSKAATVDGEERATSGGEGNGEESTKASD